MGGVTYLLMFHFFYEKHEIDVPDMNDMFITQGQRRCRAQEMINLHHHRVELLYTVIDMQMQELNGLQ